MDVLDRVRGLSTTDLQHRSLGELQTLREELRTAQRAAYDDMDRITRAMGDSGTGRLTKAQQRDFDTAEKRGHEAHQLAENVADAIMSKDIDRSQILRTSGVGGPGDGSATLDTRGAFGLPRHAYTDGRPLTREQTMAGFARSRGEVDTATDDLSLRKFLRGAVTGDWRDASAERRAMSEGVLAGGGFMVPTVLSAEVIDLARNRTRVLEAGARIVPMASKTVDVARWVGDPSAAWHTEGAVIAPSDAAIGKLTLTARALAALTVVSRELLEDAVGIEDQLRLALAAQFALTIDRAALYGSGVDPEPRGVANTSGVTTLSMGTDGATPTSYDWQVDAVGELADRNETATATLVSPRTARTIGKLKASDGQPLQAPTYVANVPRLDTAQIPNDHAAGTATAASEAFTGDWAQLMVGVRTGFSVQVLTERYADTGQIGLLCWYRGDVAVARPSAFVRTTGILA